MKHKIFVWATIALLVSPFVGLLALCLWLATGDDFQRLPESAEELS